MHSTKFPALVPVVEVSNTTWAERKSSFKKNTIKYKKVFTPQRKADPKNKIRFKLKDLKDKVLSFYKVKTKQIKDYVLKLGYWLDLRLTARHFAVE